MDVKGDSGESLERKQYWGESIHFIREYVNNHKQNVGRKYGHKGHFGEVSGGNEEQFVGTEGKVILVVMWQRT